MIERVVVYRPSRRLQPNTLYTAELVPSTNPGSGLLGIRPGALEEGPVPLRFSFRTGSGPRSEPAPEAPTPDTCETMTHGPLDSCATCHATKADAETAPRLEVPAHGARSRRARAASITPPFGQVAHQTETGNSAVGEGCAARRASACR